MKDRKVLYKMLVLTLPVLGLSLAQAETPKVFKPSTEPVFSTPRAKPNIHMVLDDSASMKGSGSWDVTLNGQIVERRTALDYAYKALLNKYKDKAYIGVSFLWQTYKLSEYERTYDRRKGQYIVTPEIASGLLRLPIKDYSELNVDDFSKTVINPISELIMNSPGNTPMYPGIYEAIKMFRGQPITANGVTSTRFEGQFPIVSLVDNYETIRVKEKYNAGTKWRPDWKERWVDQEQLVSQSYPSIKNKSPVRYRCQQNHMIVMTDGVPNDTRVWGIDTTDGLSAYTNVSQSLQLKDGDVNLSAYADISTAFIDKNPGEKINHINILGRLTADMDLRQYQTGTDEAGKPWINDLFSMPMPIYMHTVSLGVNSKAAIYTGLTSAINIENNKDQPGLNLGFEKNGSAEDLLAAFDTIFATIIRSTSSASAVNDRTSSALVKNKPKFNEDGSVDVKTIGTVRYDTTYDFRSYIGSIRARTSYLNPKTGKSEKVDLWTTDDTILPTQGRYVTLSSDTYPGKNLATLDADNTGLTDTQVKWITNFKVNPDEGNLRARLYPLGSITSPDVVIANKDILNINISKDKMSKTFGNDLSNWWLYKAKFQPNNLIVTADNDGIISFIKAQRGLSEDSKAGERDTAYFPKMLVPRFNEIAKNDRVSTLVMEGRTNLVDAKVYQPTDTGGENIYATIGLTAQGGGGKGLVGYRIYAASEGNVTSKIALTDKDDVYGKVTPLFEITDKTSGFGDLGYTYSGFEFFNHTNGGKPQAVAVFGNGFGTDKSVLYFIDAYTGKQLREIVLDPNGKGAATPSMIVSSSITGGQKVDRIYVGDYSGSLYKIEFSGDNTVTSPAKITALFKAPETKFGQSAISVKPLVVKARNSNLYRVFFGTGLAASYELDRGTNSAVQHNVYGITDYGNKGSNDNYIKCLGKDRDKYDIPKCEVNKTLEPVLTTADLKEGKIQYKGNQQLENQDYESFNDYDLDITVPYDTKFDEKNPDKDGWYIKLIADGNASGERVIKDPQYDTHNDAVIFFTWGINERNYKKGVLDDPCLADFIYGKTLAFSASSGSFSDGLKGLSNKGKTGRAEGGLTGEWIDNAPAGNSSTSLNDLAKEMSEDEFKEKVDELVDAVGEGNSAISDDPFMRNGGSDVTVEGDTVIEFKTSDTSGGDGSSEDITVTPPKKPQGKKPIRLSIQTLLNS